MYSMKVWKTQIKKPPLLSGAVWLVLLCIAVCVICKGDEKTRIGEHTEAIYGEVHVAWDPAQDRYNTVFP